METLRPGDTEYQAQALLEYEFRFGGCTGPPTAASAPAAPAPPCCTTRNNDRTLADGELLLVDAAGEYGGYCADITRTFPVGAAFSKPQAALYDIVLGGAEGGHRSGAPRRRASKTVHKTALRVLVEGLIDLGLLEGSVDECIEKNAYAPYYMHNTSHWLGMDVHDAGSYRTDGASRPLEAGMVLTVEPGLYVPADAPSGRELARHRHPHRGRRARHRRPAARC